MLLPMSKPQLKHCVVAALSPAPHLGQLRWDWNAGPVDCWGIAGCGLGCD